MPRELDGVGRVLRSRWDMGKQGSMEGNGEVDRGSSAGDKGCEQA